MTILAPKITDAERLISFELPNGYAASMLGNIEAPGMIQYHYVLVVFGQDQEPCKFYASEWSRLDPSYRNEPVFGVFSEGGHANMGGSPNWVDRALFLLRAVEVAKEDLLIEGTDLTEGEAWALTDILKSVQDPKADNKQLERERWAAISRNDARLVSYMQRQIPNTLKH
jgi:hypothetical protein